MAFHIWFTWHTGMWEDFLDSYRIRHSPPSAPYVIDRHTQWMDLLYGRVPIVSAAAYAGAELPHAWHNWIDSRVLMGTHGESHYDPEQHKLVFAKDVNRHVKPDERVIIHYGQLGARKEMWFYLDRSFDNITTLAEM